MRRPSSVKANVVAARTIPPVRGARALPQPQRASLRFFLLAPRGAVPGGVGRARPEGAEDVVGAPDEQAPHHTFVRLRSPQLQFITA
jgi:hypothetical protein